MADDLLHGQSVSKRWACPRCGSTGYVVAGVLRCGNAGCPNTHEYDPATGLRRWSDADYDRADGHA